MVLAVVVALACPAALPTEVSALVGTRKYTITMDTVGVALPVALPADSVWRVLPGVYKSMGLPLDENNPATRRLGTC